MKRDVQEALADAGCTVESLTETLQVVSHAWRTRPSDARPWVAGTRHSGECMIAVDCRRETILISCDAFGASVWGLLAWPMTPWTDEERSRMEAAAYERTERR